MAEKETLYRIVKLETEDGKYVVDNHALLDHPLRAMATGATVKFKNHTSGEVHEKECLWLMDTITEQTMFVPVELLEETEPSG